jgi:hypothetical protein
MKGQIVIRGLCLVAGVVIVLMVGSVEEAAATCTLNGAAYQTGTRVGPYTCMPDGSWRR